MHAALACETERVECGSLVYSIGYRHPAVLAKAITAIDLISGGRAAMGIGAGWAEVEYQRLRHRLPDASAPAWTSSRRASPSCAACCTTRPPTFEGQWFRSARRATSRARCRSGCRSGSAAAARSARCASPPGSPTGGTCRSCRPRRSPPSATCCTRHCADVGRDPAEIRCAVNVGLAWTRTACASSSAPIADVVRPGVLSGSVDEVVDRVGEYVEAGADQVNLALRAPFDVDALEQFSATCR